MTTPTTNNIRGRAIVVLVHALAKFWQAHRSTLIGSLTEPAVAAMDTLVSLVTTFDQINPPGPF